MAARPPGPSQSLRGALSLTLKEGQGGPPLPTLAIIAFHCPLNGPLKGPLHLTRGTLTDQDPPVQVLEAAPGVSGVSFLAPSLGMVRGLPGGDTACFTQAPGQCPGAPRRGFWSRRGLDGPDWTRPALEDGEVTALFSQVPSGRLSIMTSVHPRIRGTQQERCIGREVGQTLA